MIRASYVDGTTNLRGRGSAGNSYTLVFGVNVNDSRRDFPNLGAARRAPRLALLFPAVQNISYAGTSTEESRPMFIVFFD